MAVLDPEDLLDQARFLLTPRQPGPPLQVDIRRAISSAYYAVFHGVLTASADAFIGKTKRTDPRYAMVYRSIYHRTLRDVCNSFRGSAPQASVHLRDFTNNVVELQDLRHAADYDPAILFRTSKARTLVAGAQTALRLFDTLAQDERLLFLTKLTFKKRT